MARMKAVMAAVQVMEKEGITQAFGVPGAAINPMYAALKERQSISHILARHVEGASHMAEGYTRAAPGNIGVCIGTSGPAGTDMITGLYSAIADSIPILCITGQAPRARLYKEDFQAVDIESIAKPVTKMAVTVREPAQVPRVFQQAFHLMRSGRPGPVLIDLPFDVQMAVPRNHTAGLNRPGLRHHFKISLRPGHHLPTGSVGVFGGIHPPGLPIVQTFPVEKEFCALGRRHKAPIVLGRHHLGPRPFHTVHRPFSVRGHADLLFGRLRRGSRRLRSGGGAG